MDKHVQAALDKARERAARATSKLKGSNGTESGPIGYQLQLFNKFDLNTHDMRNIYYPHLIIRSSTTGACSSLS